MTQHYEILGYDFEIYYRGKYYGSIRMTEPDRETFGYSGRREFILPDDWSYKKKKLKKGTKVMTECIPLCGKLLGSFRDKINTLENSKVYFNYR